MKVCGTAGAQVLQHIDGAVSRRHTRSEGRDNDLLLAVDDHLERRGLAGSGTHGGVLARPGERPATLRVGDLLATTRNLPELLPTQSVQLGRSVVHGQVRTTKR
jgi:hypothetical protein